MRATPKLAIWICNPDLYFRSLGVTVMMVPVMMVVPTGCKGRAGDYQQHEGGENQLLHAMQISTILSGENGPKGA